MSYIDLDDRHIQGGKLWRLTTLMNWYLSDNVRLEFAYGYGILDRFGLEGNTHFFQSRLQLTL
jgi:phosphate-selective porin OprO/OprP